MKKQCKLIFSLVGKLILEQFWCIW